MSSNAVIVEALEVAKCYQIYERPEDRLKQFLWRGRKKFYREFWALHPISFSLQKGECLGFVGRNGSGKSTLLQILAGTLNPSSGGIKTSGRIAALLELGAGFNPEFSGRENVRLNAAILGLKSSEIVERFDSILEFSEIGRFIDEPIKTYSSGMYVRLAFSVAIHVSPEVLIIDEALSVGDAAFQYKCLRKIEELREQGVSIVLVSHDSAVIKRFCGRAGWLHEGRLISFGDAVDVVHQYEDYSRQQMKVVSPPHASNEVAAAVSMTPSDKTAPSVKLLACEPCDERGVATRMFVIGAGLTLNFTYQVESAPDDGLVLGAAVFRKDDLYVCGLNTFLDKVSVPSTHGEHVVSIHYPKLPLLPGSYYVKIGIFDKTATVRWDFVHLATEFTVVGPYLGEGVAILEHEWCVRS